MPEKISLYRNLLHADSSKKKISWKYYMKIPLFFRVFIEFVIRVYNLTSFLKYDTLVQHRSHRSLPNEHEPVVIPRATELGSRIGIGDNLCRIKPFGKYFVCELCVLGGRRASGALRSGTIAFRFRIVRNDPLRSAWFSMAIIDYGQF